MKKIVSIILIIVITSCSNKVLITNTPIQNLQHINNPNDTILLGRINTPALQQLPYNKWYAKNYEAYKVDTPIALNLKPLLQNKTIELFLGTWCGDSKREVPKMLKILETTDFDTTRLKIVCLNHTEDTYKRSNLGEEKNKNVFRVPTLIMYEDNKEIGRIVETPLESFEKDLITLATKLPYTPKYKAATWWLKNKGKSSTLLSDDALANFAIQLKPITRSGSEFNSLGYTLLAQQKFNEALNVFKLNNLIYPNNANLWDSLAEAYERIGNKELVIETYKKILELDPTDKKSKEKIEQWSK